MARRNRDQDPILDANDALTWVAYGLLFGFTPVFVRGLLDWPWWSVRPMAMGITVVALPLTRRLRKARG